MIGLFLTVKSGITEPPASTKVAQPFAKDSPTEGVALILRGTARGILADWLCRGSRHYQASSTSSSVKGIYIQCVTSASRPLSAYYSIGP